MTLDELYRTVDPTLRERLKALHADFSAQHGQTGADAFAVWLREQGHISPALFQELLFNEQVEVTLSSATWAGQGVWEVAAGSGGAASAGAGQGSPAEPSSHYSLLGMLGKGAMGLVHLAKDVDLQRKVAYKQLLGEMKTDRLALMRFLREAQITAQLDHPHIVPVYGMEIGEDGSIAYSMKLVQGKTFRDLIHETRDWLERKQPLDEMHSLNGLLGYFIKVCDAMAYAHSKGVIHRDLKPANIMVGRYNEVYVMDWGIARVMHVAEPVEGWVELLDTEGGDEAPEERTQYGQILGTPRYMSPQQAAGKNDSLDGRSDQFALGLILFELLTLKPAFTGSSQIDLLKKVLKAEKQDFTPQHASLKIPPELIAIINKATARKPEQRYDSVNAMADDLRRYLRGEAVLAHPDSLWQKTLRWIGQHRELTLLSLLGFLLLSGGLTIGGLALRQQELIQTQQRETRLMNFFTHVSQQSQKMDLYFQNMESLVQGLASVSAYSLTHGEVSADPLYLNNPYAPPGSMFQAPDLITSPYYTGEISPVWPIYVLSPGVSRASVESKLRQLSPLRHDLKEALMQSYTQDGPPLPKAQWDTLLAQKGVPVLWSYIALKEGVLYFYPGHDEPTQDYDVRIRPYYTQAVGTYGNIWGSPYHDPVGGPLIPCSRAIYDQQGEFLGIVGIDIRLNELIQNHLKLPDEAAAHTGLLLNAAGQIMLSTQDAHRSAQHLDLQARFETPLYDHPALLQALKQGKKGGVLQSVKAGQNQITAYYLLNTLGWYYVVEADEASLINTVSGAQDVSNN